MNSFIALFVLGLFALVAADCSTPLCAGGDVCCGHGRCIDNYTLVAEPFCVCFERYAGDTCTYSRKHAVFAVPLTVVFGPWGFDRFYLGYTGMGIAKLFFGVFFTVTIGVFGLITTGIIAAKGSGGDTLLFAGCGFFFLFLLSSVGFFLWLVDAILILSGRLADSNGHHLSWVFY